VTQILGPSIRLLDDPRLPSFQAKADAILRGDGSTIAPGHPVLGGHGGQRAVDQWMQSNPISHAPDIILHDYDRPGSFVLIDLKTLDAAGSAHVAAHHTDRERLPAQLAIAAAKASREGSEIEGIDVDMRE
jgi:hypothetical protein